MGFIAGFVLGGIFGVITIAMCQAAKRADDAAQAKLTELLEEEEI